MKIIRDHPSPNFDAREIPVEFVVLHYTAFGLEKTLRHLTDRRSAVSSHLVVAKDGTVYELVGCLEGKAYRAWHSGKSQLELGGKLFEAFNDISIGIELVNPNGNLVPYTDEQYGALQNIVTQLQTHYPQLRSAERIVGHEMIAGFRGKADPGIEFDWKRFFETVFPGAAAPPREPLCPREIRDSLRQLADFAPKGGEALDQFWGTLSLLTERIVAAIQGAKAL